MGTQSTNVIKITVIITVLSTQHSCVDIIMAVLTQLRGVLTYNTPVLYIPSKCPWVLEFHGPTNGDRCMLTRRSHLHV